MILGTIPNRRCSNPSALTLTSVMSVSSIQKLSALVSVGGMDVSQSDLYGSDFD